MPSERELRSIANKQAHAEKRRRWLDEMSSWKPSEAWLDKQSESKLRAIAKWLNARARFHEAKRRENGNG